MPFHIFLHLGQQIQKQIHYFSKQYPSAGILKPMTY